MCRKTGASLDDDYDDHDDHDDGDDDDDDDDDNNTLTFSQSLFDQKIR